MSEARVRWLAPFALALLASPARAQEATPPVAPASAAGERSIDAETAVAEALKNNADYKAAQLDVEKSVQSINAEEGRYPFVLFGDAGYTRSKTPRLAAGDTVTSTTSRSYTIGGGLRRTFPMGTTMEVRLQGERFENDASSTSFGGGGVNGYGLTGRASVTQPLARGAGLRVGQADLRAARVGREAAMKSRVRTKSELVRDVLTAYWELWYATEALRIEQAAVVLAKRQEKEAQDKVSQGSVAPADVLSFSSRVAQLEESVVTAELSKEQRSLELARLMGSSGDGATALAAATPPPPPGRNATRADLEASLKTGSVELAELEAQAKLARTKAEIAGESSRPRVDLEGYLESEGLSERVPKAAERAGQMKWVTAHIGLIFELPLDDSKGKAERTSALYAVRIAEQNLKAARDRIAAQASLSAANESAAVRRVSLAQKTLVVAVKTHEAERARFELGNSVPIQVQQAEDDVRRARLRVARAKVDLRPGAGRGAAPRRQAARPLRRRRRGLVRLEPGDHGRDVVTAAGDVGRVHELVATTLGVPALREQARQRLVGQVLVQPVGAQDELVALLQQVAGDLRLRIRVGSERVPQHVRESRIGFDWLHPRFRDLLREVVIVSESIQLPATKEVAPAVTHVGDVEARPEHVGHGECRPHLRVCTALPDALHLLVPRVERAVEPGANLR